MAQGDQTPLKHFITLYSTTIMRMRGSATIPHRTITLVGQEPDINDEILANSQEQSEPDDVPQDGVMSTLESDELPLTHVSSTTEPSPSEPLNTFMPDVANAVTPDSPTNETETEIDRLSSIID